MKIGQAEMQQLSKYANMFYNYRVASVWSPPEQLAQKKCMLDPSKPMDAYSFGLLLWEVWHEKMPFDGDLSEAESVVINDDNRPAIEECP